MLTDFLLPVLAFGTLLAVVIFALVSQHRTVERMHDRKSAKSTLASDQKSDGRPADV